MSKSFSRKPNEEILRLFKEGKSIEEIAKECGMKKISVRKRLREWVLAEGISNADYRERLSEIKPSSQPSTMSATSFSLQWGKPEKVSQPLKTEETTLSADTYTTALNILTKARVPVPVWEMARLLGLNEAETINVLDQLKQQGFNINIEDSFVELYRQLELGAKLKVRLDEYCAGDWKRIGFVTDTHLASKYAREDVLANAYDLFDKEGIKLVLHAGNIIDGYCKRINHFDLLQGMTGYTTQVQYLVDRYPRHKGIETWYITGDDHEGWWIRDVGLNIGEYIELKARQKGRTDLRFIGHIESDIELIAPKGSAWLRVAHPGGGSAYATSYTAQKIAESLQGGEKPHVLLLGHYHKFNQDFPREVHTVQGGCLQDQTPFLRKKKIQCHVGFCILDFHQSPTGEINRFRAEWINFYDRSFYKQHDRFVSW